MNVKLVKYTPNPEETVANAARLCYSDNYAVDVKVKNVDKFIEKLVALGHYSPFEHASFTFAIDGISRACSHQLVRHRVASYSQRSQRYVSENQFEYVIPKTIEALKGGSDGFNGLYDKYQRAMNYIQGFYEWLVLNGIPKEDARYVLPNATCTSIMVTMNARSLMNFFKLRCCNRAQWEIRELADEMLRQCKEVAPLLFKNAGASCVSGKCPEGDMSCGKPRKI